MFIYMYNYIYVMIYIYIYIWHIFADISIANGVYEATCNCRCANLRAILTAMQNARFSGPHLCRLSLARWFVCEVYGNYRYNTRRLTTLKSIGLVIWYLIWVGKYHISYIGWYLIWLKHVETIIPWGWSYVATNGKSTYQTSRFFSGNFRTLKWYVSTIFLDFWATLCGDILWILARA